MITYWHRLRALNPNAKRYLISTVFRAMSFGIWSLLFNLYLTSLGFDAAFIGLLGTLSSATSMVFALPAGLIADRIGRKRTMAIGFAGLAVCRFGAAAFSQGWLIAVFNTLWGVAGPLLLISVAPFLMENSTPKERALLFTVDGALMNFSMFVANTLGGYLPRLFATVLHVGVESTPAYRGALWTAAAAVALGLVPVLGLEEIRRPAPPRAAAPIWRFWQRLSDPRLLAKLSIPRIVIAFGAGLIFPFLNLFYKERFGVSDAALGWVFGITSVVAALMMFASGPLAERWGTIRAMLVARTISTPIMFVIGFVPSFPVVVAAHWIRSGLMRLGEPLYMAFAMEQFDESERATGSSLMRMSWDVGWAAGPALSGLVQVHAGFGPLFVAAVVFYALSLTLVYLFFGRRR